MGKATLYLNLPEEVRAHLKGKSAKPHVVLAAGGRAWRDVLRDKPKCLTSPGIPTGISGFRTGIKRSF